MPELNVNNPITADGAYTWKTQPGARYVLGAASASWAGSLAVAWAAENGTLVAFPSSPLTANGGFEFVAPGKSITLTASGSIGTTYISLSKAS